MAAIATSSALVAPAALNASVSKGSTQLKSASLASAFVSSNAEFSTKTVSNGSRVSAMLVRLPLYAFLYLI
jgi:hypothetical protein